MTLAEFQPCVEQAVTAHEWATARARWRKGLLEEREAINKHLPLAGLHGIEPEPLQVRLLQIELELTQDVTEDRVSQSPLRSVPMDMITAAIVRNVLGVQPDFPIVSFKEDKISAVQVAEAVRAIASRWKTPNGAAVEEQPRHV